MNSCQNAGEVRSLSPLDTHIIPVQQLDECTTEGTHTSLCKALKQLEKLHAKCTI